MNTYKLTLLAILAALGIAGRAALSTIPNVQPVTAIIILCGIILGPLSSIILACLITFLSNVLLGMGIWTIWQIISWSLIGCLSGLLGKLFTSIPVYLLALYAAFCGYLYGFIISLTTYQITGKFWPYYLSGLPFDTYHAIGNAIFIVLLYPIFQQLLKKYANGRFQIRHTD